VKDVTYVESLEEDHKQTLINEEELEYFYKLWEEDRL
jgi:hypothetical protein